MAKIENTIVYPTVTPAASDLLIATDVSNNNKTVTFLVSSIAGGGVLQDLQSVLTTGNTAIEDINLTGNITVAGTVAPTTITALGSTGTVGQILSSTATGLLWITPGTKACCTWDDTLTQGNNATQNAFISSALFTAQGAGGGIVVSNPATLFVSGLSTFTNQISLNSSPLIFNATAQITDSTGATGVAGQWLTSQGPGLGVEWSSTVPAGAANTLQQVLSVGNTSLNTGMTFTGTSIISLAAGVTILSSGNNVWNGTNTFSNNGNTATTAGIALPGTLWDGTSIGTAGQVLSSTGAGVAWINPTAGGGNNLQQVLDLGNVATGANANITISGALTTGTLIDSSGSAGAIGQYLSINGSGLSWVNNACCNLQNVLNVGATANTSIILTGAGINLTAPVVIPALIEDGGGSTGLSNQVLTMNAAGTALQWNAAPASGVSSVTIQAGTTSIGTPISQSATTGAILWTPHEYAGGTNVGYVPTGGNNDPLLFLNGTGNWTAAAGGGAVTSVNTTAVAISTGNPLVIAPTSGAVLVTPKRYDGFTNEGFVPRGGGATTFLRGDGSWAIPPGGAGVTSLTAAYAGSTGLPMDLSAASGAITITSYAYTGGTDVGHVPLGGLQDTNRTLRGDGSWQTAALFLGGNFIGIVPDSSAVAQNTHFLRADGTWQIPAGGGGAVTTVTASAPATSTGVPITIAPTSGAVVVTSNAYAGTNNVGHVPVGGTNTTFLRGDATWKPIPNDIIHVNYRAIGQKISAGTSYFALPGNEAINTGFMDTGLQPVSLNAPDGGTWTTDELQGAVAHTNASFPTSCIVDTQILCGAKITISSNVPSATFTTKLWKVFPCTATTPVLMAEVTNTFAAPLPTSSVVECGDFVLTGTTANLSLAPGAATRYTLSSPGRTLHSLPT